MPGQPTPDGPDPALVRRIQARIGAHGSADPHTHELLDRSPRLKAMRDPANKPFYEGTIEQTFGKTVEQQQKDVDTPKRVAWHPARDRAPRECRTPKLMAAQALRRAEIASLLAPNDSVTTSSRPVLPQASSNISDEPLIAPSGKASSLGVR